MSIKTDKSKYEAKWKLYGWGAAHTCNSHYAYVYFDTKREMEDWVEHNKQLPSFHRWAKYFTVIDLETGHRVHRNQLEF